MAKLFEIPDNKIRNSLYLHELFLRMLFLPVVKSCIHFCDSSKLLMITQEPPEVD